MNRAKRISFAPEINWIRLTTRTVLTVCSMLAVSSHADIVTYKYSGVITRIFEARYLGADSDPRYAIVDVDASSFFAGKTFAAGDTFSGVFEYDSDATGVMSADGTQATYLQALLDATVQLAEHSAPSEELPRAGNGSVAIVDDRGDAVDVFQINQPYFSPDWFSSLTISLQDRTGTAIEGFSIPEDISLEAFPSAALFRLAFLDRFSNDQLHLWGNVLSLERVGIVPVVDVDVEIKPSGDRLCFSRKGKGVIPVTVFGESQFDASTIDISGMLFSGLQVRLRGNGAPMCSLNDVNQDGYSDLTCHFEDDPDRWSVGEGSLTVFGSLYDGTTFRGEARVCVEE